MNQLMTTFIPSLLILCIAQTTVYFKPEHFKTCVPVVVSALLGLYKNIYYVELYNFLVMYTLYSSVSKTLPTTSYMKAVEWWLLYHIVVPISLFLALFVNEHRNKQANSFSFNKILGYFVIFGRFVLPFITILFVVIFSLVVFLHKE